MKKYLYNHTSEETAYVVDDYPWGFRLRTKIRYWIETNAKHGDRFCSQTVNPKTGKWCAAKKSTYSPVMVLYVNDKDHVHVEAINNYCSDEILQEFIDCHNDNLSSVQKTEIIRLTATNNIMKHVKFECINTTFETSEQKEARELESNRIFAKIQMAIQIEKNNLIKSA